MGIDLVTRSPTRVPAPLRRTRQGGRMTGWLPARPPLHLLFSRSACGALLAACVSGAERSASGAAKWEGWWPGAL